MPYIRETCVAGKTIEINKYYTFRNHSKGEKRAAREHPSSEAQKRINQRKAVKELRRLMNCNFSDGDLLVRLDFYKRPNITGEEMQHCMAKCIRKLRNDFAKREKQLKYIYVKEIGPRGGRHIHMLLSRCQIETLTKVWPHGGIHIDPLNSNGQYSRIAEYFIKYALKTEATEGQLIGKRYYCSRNLEKPKVTKRVIASNKFRKEPKERKGYYLDKDSIRSGISGSTGYEFFSYTLIKQEDRGGG